MIVLQLFLWRNILHGDITRHMLKNIWIRHYINFNKIGVQRTWFMKWKMCPLILQILFRQFRNQDYTEISINVKKKKSEVVHVFICVGNESWVAKGFYEGMIRLWRFGIAVKTWYLSFYFFLWIYHKKRLFILLLVVLYSPACCTGYQLVMSMK